MQLRSPGEHLLHRGDYAAAVAALGAEEAQRPADIRVKRALGIALRHAGQTNRAVVKLTEAAQLDPSHVQTYFFLAEALEADGQLERAVENYSIYLARGGRGTAEVRARLRGLSNRIAAREIRRALEDEASLTLAPPPDSTLAVLEFTNASASERLAPLAKGLAALMITDLMRLHRLRVLERGRIADLLRELQLAEAKSSVPPAAIPAGTADTAAPDASPPARDAGLIDMSSAPRLGCLIRTRRFVKGAFLVTGESEVQLDAFLLDAVTRDQAPVGPPVVGDLSGLIRLEKQLVFQTLEALGIEPTAEERLALGQAPTESFSALLAYFQGLTFEDEGRTQEALQSYREAIGLDPSFRQAEEAKDILEVTPVSQETMQRAELEATIEPKETAGSDDIARELLPIVGNGPAPLDPVGSASEASGQGDDQSATDAAKPETGGGTVPPFPPPPGGR